jgi:hypothetical protein
MRAAPLIVLLGCPAPRDPSECDIGLEIGPVSALWPYAQGALDARDVYELERKEAVWYWAHGSRTVQGFGVTLALIDEKPGPGILFDPIEDLPGRFKLRKPSLLFFDETDGPPSEWPLIGTGYHYLFQPCRRPDLDCVAPESFWVHEAGYHHVPLGDGGMHAATEGDLRDGLLLDPELCDPIYDDDLRPKLGMIRHGRSWVVHLWLDPEGGEPSLALEDPWRRWEDAPSGVLIEDQVFLEQDPSRCDCTAPPPPRSAGCGVTPEP